MRIGDQADKWHTGNLLDEIFGECDCHCVAPATKKTKSQPCTSDETAAGNRSHLGCTLRYRKTNVFCFHMTNCVQRSAEDAWTDTETKAIQLRLLLGHERKQTDDFEAYLERALTDEEDQKAAVDIR